MAEGKKKVIWYTNWCETYEKLSDEEAGRLIKHFCGYITDKDPEPPDRITDLLFDPIKDTLKRDLIKWESLQERNKINGSKGGRPSKPKKTEPNPEKPNGLNVNPKKGVTVTVTDTVSVNATVRDIKEKPPTPKGESVVYDELLIFFNSTFKKASRVVNDQVKKKYKAREKEGYTFEDFKTAMVNASKNQFHLESNYDHCTLEFFSRQDKLDKYLNAKSNGKNNGHTQGNHSAATSFKNDDEVYDYKN